MARTPNYSFEKRERERRKAEKKAKRTQEKQEAREKKSQKSTGPDDVPSPDGTMNSDDS